jgi:hypothetical protein
MSGSKLKNARVGRAAKALPGGVESGELIAEARRSGLDDGEIVELLDFVGPRQMKTVADPIFKERLRLDLWWMMQCQRVAGRRRTDRH